MKKESLELELNQRPMDDYNHYGPLLYQLSYQGIDSKICLTSAFVLIQYYTGDTATRLTFRFEILLMLPVQLPAALVVTSIMKELT